MFFTKHNYIQTTDKDNNIINLTDISSVITLPEYLKNGKNSDPYLISDGDTPESIASTVYDDQRLSWVILIANGINDVYNDWPLTTDAFNRMMNLKYGSYISVFLKLDSVKKYNIKPGDIVKTRNNTTAKVIEWNPSLSKLTLDLIDGKFIRFATIFDENDFEIGIIMRISEYDLQSLHHFEKDGVWLDPLLGYLQSYINGNNINVVTNNDYELSINNEKRNIIIPHKNYAIQMNNDYIGLFT
jgi:hypothetical protein